MKTLKFKVPSKDVIAFAEGVQETLAQLGLAGEYDDTSPPLMGEVTYEVGGVVPIDDNAAVAMTRVMVSDAGGPSHQEMYGFPADRDLATVGRVLVGPPPAFGASE